MTPEQTTPSAELAAAIVYLVHLKTSKAAFQGNDTFWFLLGMVGCQQRKTSKTATAKPRYTSEGKNTNPWFGCLGMPTT